MATTSFEASKFISRDDANTEIREYLRYREESEKKEIFNSLEPVARNYFLSDELSFIFKKSELDELISRGKANAFRIYYAAAPGGKPTLVVVPCVIEPKIVYVGKGDAEGTYTVTNEITSQSQAARQYPTTTGTDSNSGNFDIANDDVL